MKAFGENSPTFPHHQPSTPSPPLQLAIESRVTSDDLQLAVSATDDKIVAVQSAVDSALSDRFRRMQDVVHEQARVYRGSGWRVGKLSAGILASSVFFFLSG